jgi:hypothetical protein
MGLRSTLKNWLKRLLGNGPRVTRSSSNASIHSYPVPPEETDVVEEEKRPLLCDKFLAKDTLLIDYLDKSGNPTSRTVRTDEVYEYDDGVLVLRAWCSLRNDYRTFVSNRIHSCRDAFSKEVVTDLASRLRRRSLSDPGNVAKEILDDCTLQIPIVIYSLLRYSGNKGYERRYVTGKKKKALVRWVLGQPKAVSLLQTLSTDDRGKVEDLVGTAISDWKVTTSSYRTCIGSLARNRFTNHLEIMRQELISFVEEAMDGDRARDSAVNLLKEDLLDPSFRITPLLDKQKQYKLEIKNLKKDSRKAKRKYQSKCKPDVVSKNYRRYERGEPVRLLAIEKALLQLKEFVEGGHSLVMKEEFEKSVLDAVSLEFSQQEIQDEAEMFRKRLGEGLSTAYCAFGLRKSNNSWYVDSSGKAWLDLDTRLIEG